MRILWLAALLLTLSCSIQKSSSTVQQNSFSKNETQLIHEGGINDPMRVYLITSQTDSILLRQKCAPIDPDSTNEDLMLFVNRLYRTVTDSNSLGVGIAAPQVGVLKNVIWIQRFDKKNLPFEVYLNPRIIQYTEKKQPCPEGCLSIPNKQATTQNRAYAILLEYDKLNGEHKIEMVEGFTAVIFQHEIDHLNGILFIDHLKEEIKNGKSGN